MLQAALSAPPSSRESDSHVSHPNGAAEASPASNNDYPSVNKAAVGDSTHKAAACSSSLDDDTQHPPNARLNVYIAMPEYVRERIRQRSTTRSRLTMGGVPPQIQQQIQAALSQNVCEASNAQPSALCAVTCEETREPPMTTTTTTTTPACMAQPSSEHCSAAPIQLTKEELTSVHTSRYDRAVSTSPVSMPARIQPQEMLAQQPQEIHAPPPVMTMIHTSTAPTPRNACCSVRSNPCTPMASCSVPVSRPNCSVTRPTKTFCGC